jgi:hypothetical protein
MIVHWFPTAEIRRLRSLTPLTGVLSVIGILQQLGEQHSPRLVVTKDSVRREDATPSGSLGTSSRALLPDV